MRLETKENDLMPYWSTRCERLSSQMWVPTKAVLCDLLSTPAVNESWFSTELYRVSNANVFKVHFPVSINSLKNTIFKSKNIRIYPTADQRQLFCSWFGGARFVYNKTVEYLKQPNTRASWKSIKTEILNSLPEWASTIPYQIKSVAVRDACKAVRCAKRKYQRTKEIQTVHFKKRRSSRQSCYITKRSVSAYGLYHTISGELKWAETLPNNWRDSRLLLNNGRWYVRLPVESQRKKSENQGRVVSLDPGVRTFITFFSGTSCGKLGKGDFGRIQRLGYHLDNLLSKISKAPHNQKQRMWSAANRMRWKIRDLVDELHHKTADFIVNNFDVILLPTFEVKRISLKATRKIRSKTVRALLTWAHYRFKLFLKHKAFECNKHVIDVNEAYTSKTVSWTGEIVNVGSSKLIKSKKTGDVMDRDYNGARGILLRALVNLPIPN